MGKLHGLIRKMSKFFDRVAGWGIIAIMLLIVVNVLMRTLIGQSILGAYEHVGFLSALVIGWSLAYCAIEEGHIKVEFLMAKFPERIQGFINIIINITTVGFLSVAFWQLIEHAESIRISGQVSPTTQFPFYPFIYMIAVGVVVLCLVNFTQVMQSIRKVIKK
jgi:TRAP-type C4-dicarboxylate transport system permease small subunit